MFLVRFGQRLALTAVGAGRERVHAEDHLARRVRRELHVEGRTSAPSGIFLFRASESVVNPRAACSR